MCGIAGLFRRDGGPVDATVVRRMVDRLAHRGPDASGVWTEGSVGLGHARLSIRDLSAAGNQPMADPSERVLVAFNGEIYNDRELRAQLAAEFGFAFRTRTDTELLPLGYLAWGDDLFRRLEGMFAIALWDRQRQRLLLARDGIGIKPLCYLLDGSWVVFGSEVKALLASGECAAGIDAAALHTYLAAGYCGPASSLLPNVHQVRPGSFLAVTAAESREHCYWRPQRSGEIIDPDQALAEFSELLPAVVESQLASDVPVGIFQSGGIDSTLVALTASRLGAAAPLYTASFADATHDESGPAAEVARAAGLPHCILPVEEDPDPAATFRAVVRHFDGQCADTGAYAFYRLCAEVRQQCKVVLAGDGGDEFFAGYDTYRASRAAEAALPLIPRSAAKLAGQTCYRLGSADESRLPGAAVAARFLLGLGYGGANAHMQWRRLVPAFLLPALYGPEMQDLATASPYSEYETCADGDYGNSLDRRLLSDQRFHLQSILAKVDAMSMAHGLEVRVPLLDRRIMDFAGRCAAELLLPRRGPNKRLLRQAARSLGAPQAILAAGKKGFNVPIARLLRQGLAPLAEHWLGRNPDVLWPYCRPDVTRGLWQEHRDRRANHAFALWPLLSLAEWLGGAADLS